MFNIENGIAERVSERERCYKEYEALKKPVAEDEDDNRIFDKSKKKIRARLFAACKFVNKDIRMQQLVIDALARTVCQLTNQVGGEASCKEAVFTEVYERMHPDERPAKQDEKKPETPMDAALRKQQQKKNALTVVRPDGTVDFPPEPEPSDGTEGFHTEVLPPEDLTPTEAEVQAEIKKTKAKRKAAQKAPTKSRPDLSKTKKRKRA